MTQKEFQAIKAACTAHRKVMGFDNAPLYSEEVWAETDAMVAAIAAYKEAMEKAA